MIGRTVSHYTILSKLGEGGMGVVYKAEDVKLKRMAALKFLPPQMTASSDDTARFVQEAQSAAALNHPNICTIYGIEECDGEMFIAMEFVDGQTLQQKRGTLSFKQALEIGIQIAEGLSAAHEKGIVHRDIKPDNIMIRKDGIAQIMDFGLAKLRNAKSGIDRLTKAGSTVGTAGYMSPEQVVGQEIDHRSDIFSFGILLYELLTGEPPFKGVHETALAYEIVNVDPAPMSAVRPEIDPALDAIVLECLEKDVNERAQSMKQVAVDLKRAKRESTRARATRVTAARPEMRSAITPNSPAAPTAAHVPAPAEPSPQHTSGIRGGFQNILPWGVAVAAIVALIALAFVHFRSGTPTAQTIVSAILPPPEWTFNNSIGGHMALSPDGTMLAFVAADSTGTTSLWVRNLNSASAHQFGETVGAQFPFWSPDNKFIGFFAQGKLKKAPISGAPPTVICDAPQGRGGTWNKAGDILFTPNFDQVSIHRVPASGGASTPLTRLDSTRNETNHRWPCFLPDGNHFIYTTQGAMRSADYAGALYVSALDGSIDKQLVKVSSNAAFYNGYLLYVRQHSVVAQQFDLSKLELSGDPIPVVQKVEYSGDKSRGVFSISQTGILTYQEPGGNAGLLSLYDRSGKQISDVDGRLISNIARFSPDGSHIAFDSPDPENTLSDIWQYDIVRKIATRVTFEGSSEWAPTWSPDGKRLYYSSDRAGTGDVYMKNADGTETEKMLYKSSELTSPLDCSPDEKYLLCQSVTRSTGSDVVRIRLEAGPDGKRELKPYLATQFTENNARISPDGRWCAYESDETGRTEVFVRPFPEGGGKWQISNSGGSAPIWGHDGKSIYYSQSGGVLTLVEVGTNGAALSAGSPRILFSVPRGTVMDISPDGSKFLVAALTGSRTFQPITLVINWDGDLPKQ